MDSLAEVAARLRETEMEEIRQVYLREFEIRVQWARREATMSELRGVARIQSEPWGMVALPVTLVDAWDADLGEGEIEGWTDEVFDRNTDDVRGVIDGAVSVLRKVEPLLYRS